MNHQSIAIVQSSLEGLAPEADRTAQAFYNRLFETAPHLRELFPNDMDVQGHRLIVMLAYATGLLDQPDKLKSIVTELGTRHHGYGAQDKDYEDVGEALMWALEQSLGARYVPEVDAAWREVYRHLTGMMKNAALPDGDVEVPDPPFIPTLVGFPKAPPTTSEAGSSGI